MKDYRNLLNLVLRCVAVGTSVAALALLNMDQMATTAALQLLALGTACLAISALNKPQSGKKQDDAAGK